MYKILVPKSYNRYIILNIKTTNKFMAQLETVAFIHTVQRGCNPENSLQQWHHSFGGIAVFFFGHIYRVNAVTELNTKESSICVKENKCGH